MTSESSFTFESIDNELEIARTHVRQGNLADAERVYQRVVSGQPDQVEALRFLANAALSRDNPGEAVAILSRAAQVDRGNIGVMLELGVAYRSAQRMDEARSVFTHALELSQGGNGNTSARLLLANVLEMDDRPEQALLHYFRAILDAQSSGQWLSDATTEPGLRQLVQHAMKYVATGRRNLFSGTLEPFRHGTNAARLGRVDTALASYLREQTVTPADPRQRPTFLYVPDAGADCFLNVDSLDWLANWSVQASLLENEALACVNSTQEAPDHSPFSLEAMMATQGTDTAHSSGQWMPLYQRGMFNDAIKNHVPQLSRLLDSVPLVRIPNYAPDAAILLLPPGGRTAPHRGRTNAFCTVVVTFSGSAPLQVTVGGESRQLQAMQSLAFDPSFEFEYAAIGDAQARALVFEVWNTGVSLLERDALSALATAVVDFDRRLQELA